MLSQILTVASNRTAPQFCEHCLLLCSRGRLALSFAFHLILSLQVSILGCNARVRPAEICAICIVVTPDLPCLYALCSFPLSALLSPHSEEVLMLYMRHGIKLGLPPLPILPPAPLGWVLDL